VEYQLNKKLGRHSWQAEPATDLPDHVPGSRAEEIAAATR
jgi:hypothetical protein